jgi:hypothetical protein
MPTSTIFVSRTGCSSPTPRASLPTAAPERTRPVSGDRPRRETIPYVDISTATTLANVSSELEALKVRFVIAHDIGQVRDLFHLAGAERLIEDVYPSVQAASTR